MTLICVNISVQCRMCMSAIKNLDFSQFSAFFLIHFRHLGLIISVISDGVGVTLSVLRARALVIIVTVILIPFYFMQLKKKKKG